MLIVSIFTAYRDCIKNNRLLHRLIKILSPAQQAIWNKYVWSNTRKFELTIKLQFFCSCLDYVLTAHQLFHEKIAYSTIGICLNNMESLQKVVFNLNFFEILNLIWREISVSFDVGALFLPFIELNVRCWYVPRSHSS